MCWRDRIALGLIASLLASCGRMGSPREVALRRLGLDPARPPNLLLVSIDTLRADHVGAYGGKAETPSLPPVPGTVEITKPPVSAPIAGGDK